MFIYALKVYYVFWSQKQPSSTCFSYFYTWLHYECKSNLSADVEQWAKSYLTNEFLSKLEQKILKRHL